MSKKVSRSEPIPHTCPKINNLQKKLNDINDMLSDVVTELEELREANLKLRDWGNDLVYELEEMEKEHETEITNIEHEKDRIIISLENKIFDLENERRHAN